MCQMKYDTYEMNKIHSIGSHVMRGSMNVKVQCNADTYLGIMETLVLSSWQNQILEKCSFLFFYYIVVNWPACSPDLSSINIV